MVLGLSRRLMVGSSSLIRSNRHLDAVRPPIMTSALTGAVSATWNSTRPSLPPTLGSMVFVSDPSSLLVDKLTVSPWRASASKIKKLSFGTCRQSDAEQRQEGDDERDDESAEQNAMQQRRHEAPQIEQ